CLPVNIGVIGVRIWHEVIRQHGRGNGERGGRHRPGRRVDQPGFGCREGLGGDRDQVVVRGAVQGGDGTVNLDLEERRL
ncbi:MAG: hypothetical protein M3440_06880, partial [Chloroflexota bacterium]|nr:hypothetical protein [Chloroflexota bacterium]